jgi:hypothetical protein
MERKNKYRDLSASSHLFIIKLICAGRKAQIGLGDVAGYIWLANRVILPGVQN